MQIEEGTCYPLRPKAYSEILHNIMRKPNPIKIYNSMQSVIGRKTDAPSTEIIETQNCKPLTISRWNQKQYPKLTRLQSFFHTFSMDLEQ